jgi:hypothetical protein
MKITTISKVASLVISSVMIQTAVAGHAVGIGVGPHFGGGGFGGGIFEMFFGGGFHSAPASGGGASRSSDLQIAILLNRRLRSRRSLSHARRRSLGRGSADPLLGGNGKSYRRVVETDSTDR